MPTGIRRAAVAPYADIEVGRPVRDPSTFHYRAERSHKAPLMLLERTPRVLYRASFLDDGKADDQLPNPITQICNWFSESSFNYLSLVFPCAVAAWWYSASLPVLFCVSLVSLIGLSNMLSSATDQIANHVNQTLGALLNVTFGNAIEMILAFFALRAGLIGVVKYSLLGSIVSNSIWSLGVAFLCAGRRAIFHPSANHQAIKWNRPAAGSQMSVLVAAVFCFALPCVASARQDIDDNDLLGMSHYLSILLLVCYFGYLYFSMITHAEVFEDIGDSMTKSEDEHDDLCGFVFEGTTNMIEDIIEGSSADNSGLGLHKGKLLVAVNGKEVSNREDARRLLTQASGEITLDFEEIAVMSLATGITMLAIVTMLVCAVSEWVCDSIGDFALKVGMSPRFVAFVLLPLAGNLPEFVTVVSMAAKGKIDLCVGVAIGSSMQVATFVVPCMCIMGWIIGKPMNLNFGVLETAVLFLCILKAWNIVQKKEASWFEGSSLIVAYIAVGIAFWFWMKEGTPDEVGSLVEQAATNAIASIPKNAGKMAVKWH